jgi:Flp pilus assembly protein TadB
MDARLRKVMVYFGLVEDDAPARPAPPLSARRRVLAVLLQVVVAAVLFALAYLIAGIAVVATVLALIVIGLVVQAVSARRRR